MHARTMFWRGLGGVTLLATLYACKGESTAPDGGTPSGTGTVLAAVTGNAQSARVGTQLPNPLVARLTRNGQPLAGEVVTFTVTSGGGSVTPSSATTDADGRAQTTLTLGTNPGANTVQASGAGAQMTFTATGTSGSPATIAVLSGNSQTDTVRGRLDDSLVVRVVDQFGNPVTGAQVNFTVTAGGGNVTPAVANTDIDGRAVTRWQLGPTVGTQTVSASVQGVAAAAVFNATASVGTASAVRIVSGDAQQALVGQTVPNPIVVRVTDAFGNVIPGKTVVWTTATPGGRLVSTRLTTDANGEASAAWTLGNLPGEQNATATVNGASATFGAVATLQFRYVNAGDFHGCAITQGDRGYCWGFNGDGELGTGTNANANVPTAVARDLSFRVISGGKYHSCGLTLAGVAYCWGENIDGRLGDGTTSPSNDPSIITAGGYTYTAISAGRTNTCGLTSTGRTLCWGFNADGQNGLGRETGNDTLSFHASPQEVERVAGSATILRSISVGGAHTCGIDLGGVAICWGFNGRGQRGNGSMAENNDHPTDVAGGIIFDSISAGGSHTCGIAGGTAYCWGDNTYGQLGTGAASPSPTFAPVAVAGGYSFRSISAGEHHTCGVTTANQIVCWGRNQFGQLGIGNTTLTPSPAVVAGGMSWQSVSAAETVSCGMTTGAIAYCWGDNSYGQLGNRNNTPSAVPVKVAFQP